MCIKAKIIRGEAVGFDGSWELKNRTVYYVVPVLFVWLLSWN